MTIEKNKVVSLRYELRLDNPEGELIEEVNIESPFTFIYDNGNMLPKFEAHLNGLKAGDKFEFKLDYNDAYGEHNEDYIVQMPVSLFMIDGKMEEDLLEVGNQIPMQDKDGNQFTAVVVDVKDDVATMDFNHPLAGEDLFFTGEVLSLRDATADELQHGHIHNHECTGCGNH